MYKEEEAGKEKKAEAKRKGGKKGKRRERRNFDCEEEGKLMFKNGKG
jgi:hypothetical protein